MGKIHAGGDRILQEKSPVSSVSMAKRHLKRQSRWQQYLPLKRTNQSGQGLIEYLILVALMSVASIGILRTLNQTVKSRFANAIYALQGRNQKAKTHNLRKKEYQRSDLSNFMSGAASSDNKKSRSGQH